MRRAATCQSRRHAPTWKARRRCTPRLHNRRAKVPQAVHAPTCKRRGGARQHAKRRSGGRGCAITRSPGGELRNRLVVIATVVQLTAAQAVNCQNASMPRHDCAFASSKSGGIVYGKTEETAVLYDELMDALAADCSSSRFCLPILRGNTRAQRPACTALWLSASCGQFTTTNSRGDRSLRAVAGRVITNRLPSGKTSRQLHNVSRSLEGKRSRVAGRRSQQGGTGSTHAAIIRGTGRASATARTARLWSRAGGSM